MRTRHVFRDTWIHITCPMPAVPLHRPPLMLLEALLLTGLLPPVHLILSVFFKNIASRKEGPSFANLHHEGAGV